MRDPIATNAEGAAEYLGISMNRLYELTSARKITRLGQNWFSYDDLDADLEKMRQERNERLEADTNAERLEEENAKRHKGKSKVRRTLGSEGTGPYDGKTKKLLRRFQGGSRA